MGILEDLLLSFWLPVFTKRAKRHLSSQPKFYLFDTGCSSGERGPGRKWILWCTGKAVFGPSR